MKCKMLVAFLFLSLTPLCATQTEQLGIEECCVTFQIQVPSPTQEIPKKKIDVANGDAVVEYLQTLQDFNQIPVSMYDFIIKETHNTDISKTLSDVLLRLWGINPNILVSGRSDLIKGIGDVLLDVKSVRQK